MEINKLNNFKYLVKYKAVKLWETYFSDPSVRTVLYE